MRKLISFCIAITFTLVAVGAWATVANRPQNQIGPSAPASAGINPFEMMKNAKDLPVQQFDMS